MAIHWRTEGVVLKKTNRGESDRLFMVLTKDFGKLDLWAVSERKITSKLRSGLETLCLSEFEFVQGKNKKTITDTLLKERYDSIRNDLSRLRVAFRILETLDMFLKGPMQDLKIWDLLKDCLLALNDKSFPVQRCSFVYYYFFWNLVSYLGWRPRLSMYEAEMSSILGIFLRGNISLLSGASIEKFSSRHLNKISRGYFIEVQKELQ